MVHGNSGLNPISEIWRHHFPGSILAESYIGGQSDSEGATVICKLMHALGQWLVLERSNDGRSSLSVAPIKETVNGLPKSGLRDVGSIGAKSGSA